MSQHFSASTKETVLRDISANLRHWRELRQISQERLAVKARVDRSMVSKIERQVTKPSLDTLLKLANTLEVPLADLLKPSELPPA